ncbi:MAG: bifunctional riboflavin kinase/FAD synthetase [Actinomycetota bacterium]
MLRCTDLTQLPSDGQPSVVTWGNFDGVHSGHRMVLTTVIEHARTRNARAVAVTFDPHPVRVLAPEQAPELITSLDQRLALIEAVGIDVGVVVRFSRELAQWSPERFIQEILVDALRAQAVVVGRDTRFGHRNSGNVRTLREWGRRLRFDVIEVPELTPAAESRRWSSSWVREQLVAGDVVAAARALNRPHRLGGVVVHGDHRGRELGYPTANLSPRVEGFVPADGVYAGWVLRPSLPEDAIDRFLPAAVSIGTNPTFDGVDRRVEAYVLDRDDLDLYGEFIVLELVQRLRPTVRFDRAADLIAQMTKDVEDCRRTLDVVVP